MHMFLHIVCFIWSSMYNVWSKSENPISPITVWTVYSLQPHKLYEPFLLGSVAFGLCLFHGIICCRLLTWTGPLTRILGLLWHKRVVFCERVRQLILLSPQACEGESVGEHWPHCPALATGYLHSIVRAVILLRPDCCDTVALWSHCLSHTYFSKQSCWFFPFG